MLGLLIVDDEEGVRRSLRKVLEPEGYAVCTAGDGREAIDIVRRDTQRIETVICDYKMPGIDGLETLVEIGQLNHEITRIMLTGYATMESAIESVNAGIDGFLTKPFTNMELRAKVREYNLKKHLKQFVSEQVFLEMQRKGAAIVPRRQEVSVLFCDIRGFTRMSETLDAEELSHILNTFYFSPLDAIICEYGGMLDKHIGDGIMGVFGAPLDSGDGARQSVLCALRMMEEMERINNQCAEKGVPLSIGIGIGTGEVMAGIFGSTRKKEYTVFGSAVNVAARLEETAGKNQILLCENTFKNMEATPEVQVEQIAPVELKGIGREVKIYRVHRFEA